MPDSIPPKSTSKSKSRRLNHTFKRRDYASGDGMLTSVWGPGMWHFLHTMSFNYPVNPTPQQKHQYREFIISLQNILPCKYCRINLRNNFKTFPLNFCHMKNRDTFSRYVYRLHEIVNKMLGKTSKLTYCDVRERYEHFRSRCTVADSKPDARVKDNYKLFNFNVFDKIDDGKSNNTDTTSTNKTRRNKKGPREKEKGCTEPLYGTNSKCIIKIVPENEKQPTFTVDDKCVKKRV